MNPWYNYTDGVPVAATRGVSAPLRNEYGLIAAAFDALHLAVALLVDNVFTGTQDFRGATWVRVPTPVNAADATTKAYVDAISVTAVLPSVTGQAGKVLSTNGTTTLWITNTLGAGATITTPSIVSEREVSIALGAGTNMDCALANHFTKTISGVTALTVSNTPASGAFYGFILELTNAGTNYTPSFTLSNSGTRPSTTLTVSGRDILAYYTVNGGTSWTELILQRNI